MASHFFAGQGQLGLRHPADAAWARETRPAADAQEEKAVPRGELVEDPGQSGENANELHYG